MPRFAANLTMLFSEVPFLDRFAAAAAAGFKAVECQFPYDYPPEILAERLRAHGLTMVLHNLPAGDWAAGDRGIAALPHRVDEFRDGVARAITYARALGCPRLNCLAGIVAPGGERITREIFIDNLRFAAGALDAAGIELLIEPVNMRDVPGFFLTRSAQALDLIAAVGAPNLKLQFDLYHAQIMEGDLAQTLAAHLDHIGHIQIADNPGRHEPGTGEINYPFLLRRLDELGYQGWVGCEYRPMAGTLAGLGWLEHYRALSLGHPGRS